MTRDFDIRRIEVIDDATAEMFRWMTPAERVRLGLASRDFAARMMAAGVRFQHPDWPEAAVHDEVRRRFLSATG